VSRREQPELALRVYGLVPQPADLPCGSKRQLIPLGREILRAAHTALLKMANGSNKDGPAVFLDRDGTMIVEQHYLRDPELVQIFPGAGSALKSLQDRGFLLFIVTNQSGIGRGYFSEEDMHRVHERLLRELEREQVHIEHIYYAPEAPDQPSRGRKPSPAFLLDAQKQFGIDLGRSYIIGDKLIDLECGWNARVKMPLLVRTGYGAESEKAALESGKPFVACDDLAAAAEWILRDCFNS